MPAASLGTARGAPAGTGWDVPAGAARPVRRPPGLFDVALVVATDGGLARPDQVDVSLSAADLVALVEQAGASDCDLRILTAPGEQNLPMLRAVARRLGRDVLIAPTGAEIMRMPAATAVEGPEPGDDLVPVDVASGYPVDWLTVQPSGQVGSVFGWFELVGGLVTPRTGLVALPLPDGGRILATRQTFVRARAAAATVRTGHPGLVTIGVQVSAGMFVLGSYDRRTTLVDGVGLAAALSSLPLYQSNVRLWLRWPTAAADRDRLRTHVAEFAEVTGATVWVPAAPGEVVMLDGCLDLAAVDPQGGVSRWEPYGGSHRFESDVDGRLVPVGGIRVAQVGAARLVSGHPSRERELAQRPVPPTPGTPFTCDLAVLADGRLAVRYRDGSLLAVGGRQFTQLLRDAGWNGSEVVLLSSVAPEQAAGTRRHLADLANHLGVPIRLGEAAPTVVPLPDPPPVTRAPAPMVPSQAVRSPDPTPPPVPSPGPAAPPATPAPAETAPPQAVRSPDPMPPPPATTVPVETAPPVRSPAPAPPPTALPVEPTALPAPSGPVDDLPDQDPFGPINGPVGRTRVIDGPRLMPAAATPRHGLAWLPAQPQTNAEEFDLFVACDPDPGVAIRTGVPSPWLFLAGHLDADLLAERTTAAHLLQVRVAPGTAVDLVATDVTPPDAFAQVLAFNDVYVLPAGWLSGCRVVATYRITRDRALVRQSRHTGMPLLLVPEGADHGVPGLPAEAVRWPHGRLRGVDRYLLVPASGQVGRALPLTADRPDPTDGSVLLEVRVDRGQAIDVAATAAALADLPAIRSTAPDLLASGVTLLLPSSSFDSITIRAMWRADGGTWRKAQFDRQQRLGAWLAHRQAG